MKPDPCEESEDEIFPPLWRDTFDFRQKWELPLWFFMQSLGIVSSLCQLF